MDGGDFTSENHFRFPLVLFETSFRFPHDCSKRIWKKSIGQNVEFEFGGEKETNIWMKTCQVISQRISTLLSHVECLLAHMAVQTTHKNSLFLKPRLASKRTGSIALVQTELAISSAGPTQANTILRNTDTIGNRKGLEKQNFHSFS